MIINYTLCGNEYSESIVKIIMANYEGVLIHRSNSKLLLEKFLQYMVLLKVFFMRYTLVPLTAGRLVLSLPHMANNYGLIKKILKPHEIILIDDGITFEYWSLFHDAYILPLINSDKNQILIGTRVPNWNLSIFSSKKIIKTKRKKITNYILNKYQSYCVGHDKNDSISIGYIVDDGAMSFDDLEYLEKKIFQEYRCNKFIYLWHPMRLIGNRECRKCPAEVHILRNKNRNSVIIGKMSTVLFNVASISSGAVVLSLPSENAALNISALRYGIRIIE